MPGRTRGSCRFEPYYQVQVRDKVNAAWKTARGSYSTAEEARTAAPDEPYRIVRISEDGREYLGTAKGAE